MLTGLFILSIICVSIEEYNDINGLSLSQNALLFASLSLPFVFYVCDRDRKLTLCFMWMLW